MQFTIPTDAEAVVQCRTIAERDGSITAWRIYARTETIAQRKIDGIMNAGGHSKAEFTPPMKAYAQGSPDPVWYSAGITKDTAQEKAP